MKNTFLKLFILLTLVIVMIASLASCATAPKAEDAGGEWQGLIWDYESDTKTLTVKCVGAMPTTSSPSDIPWNAVRASVARVDFVTLDGQYPTAICNYAFFGMTGLEKISIPSSVTSIGESAFELCSSLESIQLPSSVTSIGSRAFAFCRGLKVVLIAGQPTSIGHWTFKDCSALTTLAISNKDALVCEASAFEGAGEMNADKITAYSESVIITVYYKDADGVEIKEPLVETKAFNEAYSYLPVAIDGYTATAPTQLTGVTAADNIELTFNYTKNVETEPVVDVTETEPVSTEKEEKNPVTMIVALVIFAVVIGGICVGAVLLLRSDKKQKKNGTTGRKNNNDKNRYKKK